MIEILSSGNVQKDVQDFLSILIKKYNIQRVNEFMEEFFDFTSQVIKEEYADQKKIEEISEKNPEIFERILNDFFVIVEKYTEGFDFEEGSKQELEALKKRIEEK